MSDSEAAVAEVTEQLTSKIESIITSDDWKATLRVAAKFHSYSFNNVLWVQMQAMQRQIELSRVAGFRAWQNLGRNVAKGETSLRVLAPIKIKKRDDDGQPDKWIIAGFKLAPVFDLNQTDGSAIPETPKPRLLDGDGDQAALASIIEQIEAAGFTFTLTDRSELGGANGDTNFRELAVRV